MNAHTVADNPAPCGEQVDGFALTDTAPGRLTGRKGYARSEGMSDFFERPPPPDEPDEGNFRSPPWFGAPQGTLPGVVALELVLARNDKVAVCITRLAGYPTGFEFEFITIAAAGQEELELSPFHHHHRRRARGGGHEQGLDPELLRIGVQFSDGAKATNTGDFHRGQEPPAGPVMQPRGGGGRWRQEMWVWPLPPPGQVAVVCEWPAAEIALTRSEINAQTRNAQTILEAADRAQVIFPDHPNASSSPGLVEISTRPIRSKPQPHVK